MGVHSVLQQPTRALRPYCGANYLYRRCQPHTTATHVKCCTDKNMVVLCLGPVCIPLHLLLPFLLGLAHKYGYLQWVKREWVTFRFWRERIFGRCGQSVSVPAGAGKGVPIESVRNTMHGTMP